MGNPENQVGVTDSSPSPLMTSSSPGGDNVTGPGAWDWEDSQFEKVLEDTKTVSMVLYPLLCVIAAVGNACVVYLVVSRRRMRSNVTNYFIASLAVSDGLMALILVPTNYVSNVLLDYWPFGATLCPLVTYLQIVIVFQNAYTMLAMSLERYIAIMHPFLRRLGKRNCLQVVALCWLLAFLTPIPTAVTARLHAHTGNYTMPDESAGLGANVTNSSLTPSLVKETDDANANVTGGLGGGVFGLEAAGDGSGASDVGGGEEEIYWLCYESWATERQKISYTMTIMLLQYFLPLGVLVFTYARIVHVIWLKDKQHAAPGQLLAPPGQGQDDSQAVTYVPNGKEKAVEKEPDPRKKEIAASCGSDFSVGKVIKMMITVVGIYGICWLPLHVINIKSDMDPSIWDYRYMRIVWICAHWLAMSSCAYNPFIYWWMNPRFREGYIDLFQRIACCCGRCVERSADNYGRNVSMVSMATRNGHRGSQVTSGKGWHSTTQMVELSRTTQQESCSDSGRDRTGIGGVNFYKDSGYQPELSKISEATENGTNCYMADQDCNLR
ncbi:neuropeptide Y receptor [Elysia marginata]|uniref:Neuropeptide Y receptor n=1 Tax=Elysia marginata TaxID=1093978 RepID=A0AAV4F8Q9_9GAST|nr:neuropeptide Y receptor [Elysia marginata]